MDDDDDYMEVDDDNGDDDLVVFSDCEEEEDATCELNMLSLSTLVEGQLGTSAISIPKNDCVCSKSTEGYICFKWPQYTDSLCLHCCHSFSGRPVGIVLDIEKPESNIIIYMYQRFCSWQCKKKYVIGGNELDRRKRRLYYMAEAKRYIFGDDCEPTYPAHPTDVLKKFGGHLSIEEYRVHFPDTFPSVIPSNISLVGVGSICYNVSDDLGKSSERYMLHEPSSSPPKPVVKCNNILESLVGIKKK